MELGVWSLELEVWSLEFRAWSLELGVWSSEFGGGAVSGAGPDPRYTRSELLCVVRAPGVLWQV